MPPSPLLSLRDVSFTYRQPPLLESIELEIRADERLGLLGRNGMGKSTLMRIMAGELEPDHGQVVLGPNVSVTRLEQEVPRSAGVSVRDYVSAAHFAVEPVVPVARGWACAADARPADPRDVDRVLSRMDLEGETDFDILSSGMKRRVLLARSLARNPDVLLLDEPTNHLDIESIDWLERFLAGFRGAIVFVTHDRVFLRKLATRILEVDRGRLFDWSCDYATFLKRKEAALAAEAQQQAHFDRKLAEEEAWIRQGIKARRTRNEGRVRALEQMRRDRQQRRDQVGNVRLRAAKSEDSGQLVIQAEGVSFAYDQRPIVRDFSTLITRGEKIGIIGRNGAGKSTLLRLLLKQLEPDSGTVRHGTRLQTIYFDQLREQIDDEASVAENVGEGQELLLFGGKQKHIFGYLQDFLFTPERARQPAKLLSGGERNRLLLARLFKYPSNLMVLDEPTNDLDAETLELLEELVSDYQGTLLLVSHDRAFLNNVVTSVIAVEGDGSVRQYDGGYDDVVKSRAAAASTGSRRTNDRNLPGPTDRTAMTSTSVAATTDTRRSPSRLNFHEKRELEQLPGQIEALETEQAGLNVSLADPEFVRKAGARLADVTARLKKISADLGELYQRWQSLEDRYD